MVQTFRLALTASVMVRKLDQKCWYTIRVQTSIGKVGAVWSFPTRPIFVGTVLMWKRFIVIHSCNTWHQHTATRHPRPRNVQCWKRLFRVGVAKFTWFAQPLCQCVLNGNIGPWGERELGTKDTWGIQRYVVTLRTFVNQQSKKELLGSTQKTCRGAKGAPVNKPIGSI